MQHYVIKFVTDLRKIGGPGPPVSSTNKTDRHDITEILLKVALNTIKQTKQNIKDSLHSDVFPPARSLNKITFKGR